MRFLAPTHPTIVQRRFLSRLIILATGCKRLQLFLSSGSELWHREFDAQLNAQKIRCVCKDQCRYQTPSGSEGGLLRATRKTTSAANASGAPSSPSRRIATPLPYNCTPLPPRRSGGKLTITSTASPGNGNEWARMQMPLLLMSRVVPVLSRQTPSDPSQ